jgi:hypothetical protein
MPHLPSTKLACFALIAALALAGCDAVQDSVEQTVSGAVETAREQVQGGIELDLSPPLVLESCSAKWISADQERPGVLQLASYAGDEPDSFPCVFLHLVCEADGRRVGQDEFAGKTLHGRLYVQLTEAGPILFSPDEKPVEAVVRSASAVSIHCELTGAVLVSTENDEPLTISGKLVGTRL